MKKKLFSITKNILCAAMSFSWFIQLNHACVLFLGEYPYPEENTDKL